jgi:hypothetical protein
MLQFSPSSFDWQHLQSNPYRLRQSMVFSSWGLKTRKHPIWADKMPNESMNWFGPGIGTRHLGKKHLVL